MRTRSTFKAARLVVLGISLLIAAPLSAQTYQFGQNKVHYKNFDWAVFRTEHFDVHYYSEAEQTARDAARMAERGYDYLAEVLQHEFKERIPLILYASVNDFQQTNVVGSIGHGTRGVTESLKGRVVLPMTGSYREFNHVLVHELVHAFQFDIMLNPNDKNKGATRLNPPLWFVEGMAEYLSIGMDNITRTWVKDGLLHDDLLTVDELASTRDIRVYRIGESLWYYIGEKYGKRKVGDILKKASLVGDINKALKSELGLTPKDLTTAWHAAMRESMLPEPGVLQKPGEVAVRLTNRENFFHRMNVIPSISPDGRQIAYVTNRNLVDDIYLLREEGENEFKEDRFIKGSQSADFEFLRFFETSIGWSRDGKRLAFVSKSGKDDAIYIVAAETGDVLQKLVFPRLNGLLSPAFSPTGNRVAFTGMSGGRSDLFVYKFETDALTQLTDDRFAALQPQWSPDGSTIAYVTDQGRGADQDELLFGSYRLALYNFEAGGTTLLASLNGNVINPQWSPDGREIAFVSDFQGIPNIYRMQLETGTVLPMTWLETGVTGITNLTPAMSWSADGKYLVFSTFEKGSWQLYRMALPAENPYRVSNGAAPAYASLENRVPHAVPAEVESAASVDSLPPATWLPEIADPNALYAGYDLESSDSLEARDYSSKLQFDGGVAGASLGGILGSSGGLQLQFSDMLGNHTLIATTGLRFDLLNSDLGLTYLNQKRRLNFGISAFQSSLAYTAFATFNQIGYLRDTYRGAQAFALYPFNRFMRFEAGLGLTSVDRDVLVDTYTANDRDRESTDLANATYAQANAALVYDNTAYGFIGPLSGTRARISIQRAVNDFNFTSFTGDYRRYFRVGSRSAIAYRLLGASSGGRDARIFGIGGPFTFRGSDYNALFGTNFLVQNLEFRFPLLPFMPAQYDFLSAVAFVDAAGAWGLDAPGFAKETFQPFSTDGGFRLNDLRGAFGFGLRFNLGFAALRYDVGFPTDLRQVGDAVNQFSIGVDF